MEPAKQQDLDQLSREVRIANEYYFRSHPELRLLMKSFVAALHVENVPAGELRTFAEAFFADPTLASRIKTAQATLGPAAEMKDPAILEHIERVFEEVDTDGRGTLSRGELRAKIQQDDQLERLLGKPDLKQMSSMKSSEFSFEGLFGDADMDGNRELTLEEFKLSIVLARSKAVFQAESGESDGTLTRAEVQKRIQADEDLVAILGLRDLQRMSSMKIANPRLHRLLAETDADGVEERLTWNEFKSTVRPPPASAPVSAALEPGVSIVA